MQIEWIPQERLIHVHLDEADLASLQAGDPVEAAAGSGSDEMGVVIAPPLERAPPAQAPLTGAG